jgi:Zn finger protein HypA/HybF involved in hydrogenase expression
MIFDAEKITFKTRFCKRCHNYYKGSRASQFCEKCKKERMAERIKAGKKR